MFINVKYVFAIKEIVAYLVDIYFVDNALNYKLIRIIKLKIMHGIKLLYKKKLFYINFKYIKF